jgi:hypothetical protein
VSFSANSDGDWWACQCNEGWEGEDCSVKLESYCDDGYDNDKGRKKLALLRSSIIYIYTYSTLVRYATFKIKRDIHE